MNGEYMSKEKDPYADWFTYPNQYDAPGSAHGDIGSLIPGDVVTAIGSRTSDSGWTHICFPNSANPYDPRRLAFDQKYCPGTGHGMSPWQRPPDMNSGQFRSLGLGPNCTGTS